MYKPFIFDQPHATRFVEARKAFLQRRMSDLTGTLGLRTALDVGCGVGYFTRFLCDIGFQVVGVDGRRENVEEARRRNPDIQFLTADAEDPAIQRLGSFDLVLCFGLLYHLENPFRAIRNLRALSAKLLLVESMCIAEEEPVLYLRDELPLEDQGLSSLGCYPSEGCLIKMSFRAGFPFVYRFTELPEHEDFQTSLGRKRSRTMLAASKVPLRWPFLTLAAEPETSSDPWSTPWAGAMEITARLKYFLRKPWDEKVATVRRRFGNNSSALHGINGH